MDVRMFIVRKCKAKKGEKSNLGQYQVTDCEIEVSGHIGTSKLGKMTSTGRDIGRNFGILINFIYIYIYIYCFFGFIPNEIGPIV